MKILPLVKPAHVQVLWDYRRHFKGDPIKVTANYSYHHCIGVSSFELDHSPNFRAHIEETARASVMRHLYPKELIQELREINFELTMRSRPRGAYGSYYDEFADLRERLSVISAQLDELK